MLGISTCWWHNRTDRGDAILKDILQLGFLGVELEYRITESIYKQMKPLLKGSLKVLTIHNFFPKPDELADREGREQRMRRWEDEKVSRRTKVRGRKAGDGGRRKEAGSRGCEAWSETGGQVAEVGGKKHEAWGLEQEGKTGGWRPEL